MTAPQKTINETVRDVQEAWAQVAVQIAPALRRVMETLRPLAEFAQSPQGQAFIAAGEAQQALHAHLRETKHECHCLCQLGHLGSDVCDGGPFVDEVVAVRINGVDVPMCPPCARATAEGPAAR